MGYGYWTNYFYCATCDKPVKESASSCPNCGAIFGKAK